MTLTGKEKATIFLSILGGDTSSAILKYLPPEMGDIIAASINHLPTPTPEALGEIFQDFNSFFALPPASVTQSPSVDISSSIQEEEPIAQIEEEAIEEEVARERPEESILNASPQKLAYILAGESPQMAAFVLSTLPEYKRDEVLQNLTASSDQILEYLSVKRDNIFSNIAQESVLQYVSEHI